MDSPVPLLVVLMLVVAPALVLAARRGWLAQTRFRRGLGFALALTVVAVLPTQGVDFVHLKRFNLGLLLVTSGLLLARHGGARWLRPPGVYRDALFALAAVALVAHGNFLGFHGAGTYVHWHDTAHYYLGAKYYQELGYRDLYVAMLRAEAENHDNRFKAIEARDLETYERVHIRTLLRRSDPVKAAFSDDRWEDFRHDADLFRQRLDRQYGTVLLDHGFNPTPVWALLGESLTQWVPAGSARGLAWLCALDALLLLALAWLIGRTFGLETALLGVIYFCTLFGSSFGWTGGALLRYPWFVAVVAGVCALHRRRWATAGALIAVAAMLRVFPGLLLVPWALRLVVVSWRRRRIAPRDVRLFAGAAVGVVALFALTVLRPGGVEDWRGFTDNMQTHLAVISPNTVGLTEVLSYRTGPTQVTAEEFAHLVERRRSVRKAQWVVVVPPLLVLLGWLALRAGPLERIALGVPLLYGALSLAGYYWIVLVVVLLWRRRSHADLALLFAVEAIPYTLMLFSDRDASHFLVRGLALAGLFVVLWSGIGRNNDAPEP